MSKEDCCVRMEINAITREDIEDALAVLGIEGIEILKQKCLFWGLRERDAFRFRGFYEIAYPSTSETKGGDAE